MPNPAAVSNLITRRSNVQTGRNAGLTFSGTTADVLAEKTIPANTLQDGSVIHIKAVAQIISAAGTDQPILNVRLGGTADTDDGTSVFGSGSLGDPGAANLTVWLDVTIHVRKATDDTASAMFCHGTAALEGGTVVAAGNVSITEDTTTDLPLKVLGDFSAAAGPASMRMEAVVIEIKHPAPGTVTVASS